MHMMPIMHLLLDLMYLSGNASHMKNVAKEKIRMNFAINDFGRLDKREFRNTRT
jgi:hypothetical protein